MIFAAIAYIIWLLTRTSAFLLVIETNGAPMAVFSSKQRKELMDLFDLITTALETPPEIPIVRQTTNVVLGDQINERGTGLSVGKLFT